MVEWSIAREPRHPLTHHHGKRYVWFHGVAAATHEAGRLPDGDGAQERRHMVRQRITRVGECIGDRVFEARVFEGHMTHVVRLPLFGITELLPCGPKGATGPWLTLKGPPRAHVVECVNDPLGESLQLRLDEYAEGFLDFEGGSGRASNLA